MRVTQHLTRPWPRKRPLITGGAILIALALTGCSAVNMTGFSMPVFGLTKKSAESDSVMTSSIPDENEETAVSQQKLSVQ